MKIVQNYAMNEILQRNDVKNKSENESFSATLDKMTSKFENSKKELSSVTNSDIDNFLDKLTSMGASAFWLDFNQEKIENKIKEKRDELIKQLGINDKNNAELENALEVLDEILEDYIKQMLKQSINKEEIKVSKLHEIFSIENPLNI